MEQAFVAFGGNLGAVEDNLRAAMGALGSLPGVRLVQVSGLYRTAPVGVTNQADFLNGVAEIATERSPADLLARLLETETTLGRVRAMRWGPRTVDLDLVLHGNRIVDEPGLQVPHPRMHERGFVLVPLAEIAPLAVHPRLGRSIAELLEALGSTEDVQRWADPSWVAPPLED